MLAVFLVTQQQEEEEEESRILRVRMKYHIRSINYEFIISFDIAMLMQINRIIFERSSGSSAI